jgi:hypothetical protein
VPQTRRCPVAPTCLLATVVVASGVVTPADARGQDPGPVAAPGQLIETTPQGRYDASGLQRFFLGDGHRDLWATPVQARVLDLDEFAGGLAVLREGGGLQTRSLRFQGEDGQVWNFRSVDKDASRSLDPELRNTIAASVMQDRISAVLPLGAMVVAPLLEAADVLHPDPTLVVMPDDARLGEFREDFAGLLGWIEVRPDEGPDGSPGFAGSSRVIGSDRLFERIEDDASERVDAESYLRARLMDVFVGDWDRHPDQWRWAGFGDAREMVFEPVPRDRDWALSRLDGVVGSVSWAFWPHYVGFQHEYPNAFRATWSARVLDRRLLSALPRDRWLEVAADLESRITDDVIDRAIDRLPPGYEEQIGAELGAALRHRRDDLIRFADEWYALLARWVDVHATDANERAELAWQDGGGVEVRIFPDPVGQGQPYFQRTLYAEETSELRLYMHGGDDVVIVEGPGPGSVRLRVIGGGGDDALENATVGGGGQVHFYDHRGDNAFDPGPGARWDTSVFEEPFDPSETTHQAPFRDWGARWLPLPTITYDGDVGLFVGMGGLRTGYGFRAYPYHTRLSVAGGLGTGPGRFRAEASYDFPVVGRSVRGIAHVFASGAEGRRFYGFGNETSAEGDAAFFKAQSREVLVELPLGLSWGEGRYAGLGPLYKHFEPLDTDSTFVSQERPYGYQSFNEAGLVAMFGWDSRDKRIGPSRGWLVQAEARYFPDVLDVRAPFGGIRGWAAGFFTVPGRLGPTLAARAGGERVWGDVPYQEAAYLGGPTSLRGYRNRRFAGEGSLFLNSELRFRLARLKILLPEDVGIFGLADVGRVFVENEDSDTWHSAWGGGAWISLMDVVSLNLSVAVSPEYTAFYFQSGFSF